MNLAVSTFLIILALLPGIAAWNSYFARTSRFPRQLFTDSRVQELGYYVLLALIVDWPGLWLVQQVAPAVGADPKFLSLPYLLNHTYQGAAGYLAYLGKHGAAITFSYLGILLFAYLVGSVSRRVVWASRWDIYVRALRMRHEWYYSLQGRLQGLPRKVAPVVDVLASHPEISNPTRKYPGSRLYRGIVEGFELSDDGSMEQLILIDAHRWNHSGKNDWKSIPGNRFLLRAKEIHSLNMTYFDIAEQEDRSSPTREAVKAWFKSFLTEEP